MTTALIEASRSELSTLFATELPALERLQSLLEREHQALVDMDFGAISDTSIEKGEALAALAPMERARSEILRRAGVTENADGLQRLLDRCADERLQGLSDRIVSITATCQSLNLRNGVQIKKSQRFVGGALDCLIGGEQGGYYSAQGAKASGREGRSITSA